MDTPSKYVTLAELARSSRLPAAWLVREADAGRLPCLRVGRRRMFNLAAVMKALAERQSREVARA